MKNDIQNAKEQLLRILKRDAFFKENDSPNMSSDFAARAMEFPILVATLLLVGGNITTLHGCRQSRSGGPRQHSCAALQAQSRSLSLDCGDAMPLFMLSSCTQALCSLLCRLLCSGVSFHRPRSNWCHRLPFA